MVRTSSDRLDAIVMLNCISGMNDLWWKEVNLVKVVQQLLSKLLDEVQVMASENCNFNNALDLANIFSLLWTIQKIFPNLTHMTFLLQSVEFPLFLYINTVSTLLTTGFSSYCCSCPRMLLLLYEILANMHIHILIN